MKKQAINKLMKDLEKTMQTLAKDRDALDKIINESEMLREDCDEAYDLLVDARGALSRLV